MGVWGRSPHIWGLGPGTLEAEGRLMGGVGGGAPHKIKLKLFSNLPSWAEVSRTRYELEYRCKLIFCRMCKILGIVSNDVFKMWTNMKLLDNFGSS